MAQPIARVQTLPEMNAVELQRNATLLSRQSTGISQPSSPMKGVKTFPEVNGVEIERNASLPSRVEIKRNETENSLAAEFNQTFSEIMEKTIEQHVAEMQTNYVPVPQANRKFNRVRNCMQKLNEEFVATLFETDLRHKTNEKKLRDELEAKEEANEVLQCKIKTLAALQQEHLIVVKKATEKIKRLEATEDHHKRYVKMAGGRISLLETQELANLEKLQIMEAREEKVLGLAKKAAIKIKDSEVYKKKQAANTKTAVENIQTLKQMLLSKEADMQKLQEKAVQEYEMLLQEVARANSQRAELQALVAEARQRYKAERQLRKADQKKISSLRKMIEQYDEAGDFTSPELFQALTAEEPVDPLYIYRDSTFANEDEFDQVKEEILSKIPEEIKSKYSQIGFFNSNEHHFPILALSPFDVPPGGLRDKWLEKATSLLGVYLYGQTDIDTAYDMIPAESFIPYNDGVAQDFHAVPNSILTKALEGKELTPIEQVFEEGIKMVNVAASAAPEERYHPLKGFAEFGGEANAANESSADTEFKPEELTNKFRETLSMSYAGEGLEEELAKIQDEELLQVTSKKQRNNLAASSFDDDGSCISTPSLDSCCVSITSVEDQVQSMAQEISNAKKLAAAARAAAAKLEMLPEETRELEEVAAAILESRDAAEAEVEATPEPETPAPAPVVENADPAPVVEKVEPAPVAKPERTTVPKPERTTVKPENGWIKLKSTPKKEPVSEEDSLVKQRMKMFGGAPNKHPSKIPIVPDSSTKDLLKMWQSKATPTPKQKNSKRNSAFSFNESKAEFNVKNNQKQSTRCVTIPKNILKKIEAGESLTDHERKILKGIQKFTNRSSSPVRSVASEDDRNIVQQSSSVSSGAPTEFISAKDTEDRSLAQGVSAE